MIIKDGQRMMRQRIIKIMMIMRRLKINADGNDDCGENHDNNYDEEDDYNGEYGIMMIMVRMRAI